MTGMGKAKVTVWIIVVLYLALIVLTNQEPTTISLLPGAAASIEMWAGLLAIVMLLVGFAIGFFSGRASVKE